MQKAILAVLCAGAALLGLPVAASAGHARILASAQAAKAGAVPVDEITVEDLAGTWVEPETLSEYGEVSTFGEENVVEVAPDGRFTDGLNVTFKFRGTPILDGTYRMTSEGVVSVNAGQIKWDVIKSNVEPIIPADAPQAKREAMKYFAAELSQGMQEAETYRIVSYDGNKLVMDAAAYGVASEYVMTRR